MELDKVEEVTKNDTEIVHLYTVTEEVMEIVDKDTVDDNVEEDNLIEALMMW